MALPTITHNSPVAGSIAWTTFGIQYNGQSFNIPAGNTNQAFVWWLYNGGTAPALQQGNTLPTLGPDDMILFVNKLGTGVLVPTAELQEGSLIVGGSILAQAIGANQIQTEHLAANAVTANAIAAGAVTASQIAAGAITTDKLGVGTVSDSLVTNGSFEEFANGVPIGWGGSVNGGAGSVDIVTGVASSGTNAARLVLGATTTTIEFTQASKNFIPVTSQAGRKWYVGAMVGAGTATTRGLYLRALWLDANKNYLSYSDAMTGNQPITTTFQLFEGQVTPPAAARYMAVAIVVASPNVITNVYVDEIVAREVVISAQIGDGAITTPKMTANTINADRILSNTITALQIQSESITADKLLVSDRTNYWENPDFESDTVGGIPRGTTLTGTNLARVIAGGSQGSGKAMELNAVTGSNNDVYSTNIFPVEPGDQYYVRYDFKFLNAMGTANGGVGFRSYNAAKAPSGWWSTATTGPGRPLTWQEGVNAKVGIFTVPAGVYFLQPWVTFSNNGETTNRFQIDDIVIRRMAGGELIVDGAVTALKIDTDAVTATKIKADAVTATKILAGAIGTNHMTANTIHADRILANTITANQVATNAVIARHVLAGEIATAHMTANTINADRILANTITAAKIQANTITGDRIAANAITASKLAVGDFENLATINELHGVTISTNGQTQIVGGYNTKVSDGDPFFMFKERGGPVPFKNGDKILVSFTAKATIATGATPTIWVYDAASANTAFSAPNQTIGLTDTDISVIIPVGATTNPSKEWVIGLSGASSKGVQVKNVIVRRMHGGELVVDGSITGLKIAANTIAANNIAAGVITADKMTISRGANLFTDPEIRDLFGWQTYTSATGGRSSGGSIIIPQSATQIGSYYALNAIDSPKRARLVPGGSYRISGYVKTSAVAPALSQSLYLRHQLEGSTTTGMVGPIMNQTPTVAGAWTLVQGIVKIPDDTLWTTGVLGVYKEPNYTTGTSTWSDLSIQQASGGELIVDGAITTLKMTANTINGDRILANTIVAAKILANSIGTTQLTANGVNADRIVANTITATQIQTNAVTAAKIKAGEIATAHMTANTIHADRLLANTITAEKIQANAITAEAISANALDAKVITGSTVQTAASGARIVLDTNGLKGWDANNINYLTADSLGVTVTGTLNAIGKGFDPDAVPAEAKLIDVTATLGGQAMDSQLIITEQMPQPPSTVPGLGFTPSNKSVIQRSGVKSTDGINLIQHSATTNTINQFGFMSLGDHGVNLYGIGGSAQVKINGRSGVTIDSQMAALTLSGNEVVVNAPTVTIDGTLKAKHRRWEGTTTGWNVYGAQQWDVGAVVMDTNADRTTAPSMCQPGPSNMPGSVQINETGYYQFQIFVVPRSNPGVGWVALNYHQNATAPATSKLMQEGNSTAMWETPLVTVPIFLDAGVVVRGICVYEYTHLIDTRWRIVKVST